MIFKRILKYVVLLFLVGSIGFLYGFSNRKNQEKPISKIVVEFEPGSNNFLTQTMVNKLLIQNNKTVLKQPKSVIDLHKLENTVLSNPYVENATLFYTIDGTLNSTIKQRKPIARVLSNKGSYYVDRQGVKMPISDQYSARVPLITGVNSKEDLQEIYKLLQFVTDDNFLSKEIIGIEKTVSNEYFFAMRSGDYKIEFGKFNNVKRKLEKLKVFYTKAFLDKTIHNYKVINIRYHNQVVGVK